MLLILSDIASPRAVVVDSLSIAITPTGDGTIGTRHFFSDIASLRAVVVDSQFSAIYASRRWLLTFDIAAGLLPSCSPALTINARRR